MNRLTFSGVFNFEGVNSFFNSKPPFLYAQHHGTN